MEVALEGLDHMIHKPRDVYADFGGGGLATIEIEDSEGTKQIIRLRDPLMLPPRGRDCGAVSQFDCGGPNQKPRDTARG